jgi:uncharacterized protein (UPF0335 family)
MSETAEIGHNSEPVAKFAADQLKSIIERIENVEAALSRKASQIGLISIRKPGRMALMCRL